MKLELTFILPFLCIASFAQQLKFNNELVDTIYIQAHSSSYQFDDKGTTKGVADIVSIVFNPSENKYLINQYSQDKYVRTYKPDTLHVEKEYFSEEIQKDVNRSHLANLLISLSENLKSKALINQIDTSAFREYVTNKQIKKIAKKHKVAWYLKRRYSSKEEIQSFFNSCKSLDTLRLYLICQFDKHEDVIVTDVSRTINIWISTNSSEYRFEGKYPNPVKQPWYSHSDSSSLVTKSVLNLGINQSLGKILPNDFLLVETISEKALFEDYLTWYFKRREMKY